MIDLEKIKARRAVIGETNWRVQEIGLWHASASTIYLSEDQAVTLYGDQSRAEAEFIAHAPTDIDALVAEVERLRKERDEWKGVAILHAKGNRKEDDPCNEEAQEE